MMMIETNLATSRRICVDIYSVLPVTLVVRRSSITMRYSELNDGGFFLTSTKIQNKIQLKPKVRIASNLVNIYFQLFIFIISTFEEKTFLVKPQYYFSRKILLRIVEILIDVIYQHNQYPLPCAPCTHKRGANHFVQSAPPLLSQSFDPQHRSRLFL